MRIGRLLAGALGLCALAAGGALAQSAGEEIVIPAGMFSKDHEGIVFEAGGHAGTGMQAGAFKFPKSPVGATGETYVGITTLLPAKWIGHDIDIVFGGSAGGLQSGQYRIGGVIDYDGIGVTAVLHPEDGGTTEETIVTGYTVTQRRFAIAVGRIPGHAGDTSGMVMNLEYLILRLTN
jgi:hypothetical protein